MDAMSAQLPTPAPASPFVPSSERVDAEQVLLEAMEAADVDRLNAALLAGQQAQASPQVLLQAVLRLSTLESNQPVAAAVAVSAPLVPALPAAAQPPEAAEEDEQLALVLSLSMEQHQPAEVDAQQLALALSLSMVQEPHTEQSQDATEHAAGQPQPAPPPPPPPPPPLPPPPPPPPVRRDCSICFDDQVQVLVRFRACGHACCCGACARRLHQPQCPMCRSSVEGGWSECPATEPIFVRHRSQHGPSMSM